MFIDQRQLFGAGMSYQLKSTGLDMLCFGVCSTSSENEQLAGLDSAIISA